MCGQGVRQGVSRRWDGGGMGRLVALAKRRGGLGVVGEVPRVTRARCHVEAEGIWS